MTQNREWINQQIDLSSGVIQETANLCLDQILEASEIILNAINQGNKIIWCGNGGSAAEAQHLSGELVCGLRSHKRPALASISLTTDTSVITAWSNDLDFQSVFSRQIEALGNSGDVLIALSTSGNSNNIIKAIETAKDFNVISLGLTGNKESKMKEMCDFIITIPSNDTQRIQEGHLLVGHIICEIIENNFID